MAVQETADGENEGGENSLGISNQQTAAASVASAAATTFGVSKVVTCKLWVLVSSFILFYISRTCCIFISSNILFLPKKCGYSERRRR